MDEIMEYTTNSWLHMSLRMEKGLVAEVAVVPVLKVLCMGAIGALLADHRLQIINREATEVLSKLVFALFLPCLIFTELGAKVTFENMMRWWFIPVNVILAAVIGCAVGYIVARTCKPPRRYFRFTVVMTGIGNTGNIPLAIIGSICHSQNSPFGPTCNQAGVAYLSFSTWIAVIIVYTFVYHMLEPPEHDNVVVLQLADEEGEIVAEAAVSEADEDESLHNRFFETDWPGLEDEQIAEYRVPFLKKIWRQASLASQLSADEEEEEEEGEQQQRRVPCMKEPRMVRKMRVVAERTPLQRIFQPPTIASLLAIAIGLYPKSKGLFFGYGAPLGFFNDSLVILAGAMVPCIMLVLGGTLSGGPGKSELGLRTTIGVCVARLFVLPVIGLAVVECADRFGFLPEGDSMFRFVLFLHYTMPTAILCGAMASLRGYGEKEAASLLFWQHLLAVFSVSLSLAVYINFLNYI